ncbi:unnamed protein product [Angiostrongylus costaricensis]|uniref:DDE_Tnp_1 domain-containing protein n=1 Tax=Angiostrongylus costaricensis TaxID=334426 RepID=A0A0R3PVF9_ANGCS|nr:unnamed protein product [Angiostrongylus costaricensis]
MPRTRSMRPCAESVKICSLMRNRRKRETKTKSSKNQRRYKKLTPKIRSTRHWPTLKMTFLRDSNKLLCLVFTTNKKTNRFDTTMMDFAAILEALHHNYHSLSWIVGDSVCATRALAW